MTTTVTTHDGTWDRVLASWFGAEFPEFHPNAESRVDAIGEAFIGSKQVRLGPRPNPESFVRMREVIRYYLSDGGPIPVLIPSAAVKLPFGANLDLAEVGALKTLQCLQARVRPHHSAGLQFIVRMEDLTEVVISSDVPNVKELTSRYIRDWSTLARLLGMPWGELDFIPESLLVQESTFVLHSLQYAERFAWFLENRDVPDAAGRLSEFGWRGGVSPALEDFLRARYAKLYPEKGRAAQTEAMSRYLGAIAARRNLEATARPKTPFLELSFAPPLPDAPLVSTRVYYRTVPCCETSNHIPYWTARGFLRVNDGGEERPRIGLQSAYAPTDHLQPGSIAVTDGVDSLVIDAPYVVED